MMLLSSPLPLLSNYFYNHNKFWVIDGAKVGLSTGNWSPRCALRSNESPPYQRALATYCFLVTCVRCSALSAPLVRAHPTPPLTPAFLPL